MNWQVILSLLAVGIAAWYLVRRSLAVWRSKSHGACGSCSSCESSGGTQLQIVELSELDQSPPR